MQLKKLLQGSAFALVAVACAIAVPSVVKADDSVKGLFAESNVTAMEVDGTTAQMKAKLTDSTKSKELLVGFANVNSKGKVAVATWDTYDGADISSGVTIDLSKLSNTKVNYIALTTPETLAQDKITIVKIPAVKKVFKAEFDGATAAFSVGEADSGRPTLAKVDDTNGANYEYRTAYSSWTKMYDSKLASFTMYQEEGANLFVRKAGKKETNFPSAPKEGETYSFGQNAKLQAYETTSSLPGKEAKVAIKARAKGPSLSGDYTKGTVKLPKNAEYRMVGTTVGTAKPVGDKVANKTVAELKTDAGTSVVAADAKQYSVEVRTAADDKKKKAASKWSRLVVDVPQKMSFTAGTAKADPAKPATGVYTPDATAKKEYGGNGVASATVKTVSTDTNATVVFKYVTSGKLAEYQLNNAIEVENKDETRAYEIIVGKATDTAAAPADGKVIKLLKGSGKKVKLTKVADGSQIWIRVAGDKKAKTWLGEFTLVGPVDYNFETPAPESK